MSQELQLRKALQWVLEQVDADNFSEGVGDPRHEHRRPGRWDSNGKPCQSCLDWQRIRQIANPNHKGFKP